MQRDVGRVRCDTWGKLCRDPLLLVCAVVSLGFHAALYGYGFWSCRPGGFMWEVIAKQDGGAPAMQGTWLAWPLGVIHRSLQDMSNSTCGGTVGGHRPYEKWDTWVCYPEEDFRAEEAYSMWKQNLPTLSGLMVLFLLLGKSSEETQSGRVWFHSVFGMITIFISHGLVGSLLVCLMGVSVVGLSRSLRSSPPLVAVGAVWTFVVLCMELVFRLLGDHAHRVPEWRQDQGFKTWSLLETWVCGDALYEARENGELCFLSKGFVLKGSAPWITFRFMALKLISLALDDLWSYQDAPSACRNLSSKPELVRRTETNLPREKHSWRYVVSYLGYAPLFFCGPNLTYNAFVSQLDSKQKTYRRRSVFGYSSRLVFMIAGTEVFSVFWWYSQKFHTFTCHGSNNCLFDELSVFELYLAMHVRLHFTWLTLMILWRFGRMTALADGIDSPENMLGCVTFYYTFEAFWRIWHSSMNRFMLRYLYGPLGGKGRAYLAVPIVFGFVAYWHESTGFLTKPAWYAWGFLNALGVTLEKALSSTFGMRLAKSRSEGNVLAGVISFLGKGLGPIFLILVNVPAILYGDSWRFYKSLFGRGWSSALLLITLVLTFGCTATLVDAFRAEDQPTQSRAPLAPEGPVEVEMQTSESEEVQLPQPRPDSTARV